jgi:anti-sigma regulatory factor (Ser/Thr protein kinase)
MQRLDLVLPSNPSEAKRLRNELHAWLLAAGINGATGHDITTATNEAFANAVEHPLHRRSNEIRISGHITSKGVVITIRDDGDWQPIQDDGRHHYGYSLINNLMDTIDVARTRNGTIVTLRKTV